MDGTVTTGEEAAAGFVASVEEELTAATGFRPHPGTLNLADAAAVHDLPGETHTHGDLSTEHCDGVVVRPCSVAGVRAAVVKPLFPDYPEEKVEIVAPVALRSLFGLADGDRVPVAPPDEVWYPDGSAADPAALDVFDAAVFDLDGTLVDLDVEWSAVHADIEELLGDHLEGGSIEGYDRPGLMDFAREIELYDELDAVLTDYETEGAETAPELPLAMLLQELNCPVGICTANAESAARRALERFDALDAVDAIVARGTIAAQKPNPEPLERCLAMLDAPAGNAVFVGDERGDAEAAVGAGTSFLHARQFAFGD